MHLLAKLLTVAWLAEPRDLYTGGYLLLRSGYSRLLAVQAKLSEVEAAPRDLGGFLHQLGMTEPVEDFE